MNPTTHSTLSALCERLQAYTGAEQELEAAMADGGNVHGALAAVVGTKDMAIAGLSEALVTLQADEPPCKNAVEETVFPAAAGGAPPVSGNVRGVVTAFVTFKGKSKRVAHATLLDGKAPDIAITVPSKMAPEEARDLAAVLMQFNVAVAKHR